MNPLSLNVVAISVFLVVLASLLGPAVGLPPAWVAVGVAGVMGLSALDRWLWEGQAGLLALDWLAQRSPAHRDRVAHHEAGHFLVAHHLGIPVTGYALSAWEALRQGQPGQGGVRLDEAAFAGAIAQGPTEAMAHYQTVLMAGIAAEQLLYGSAEGGAEDVSQLRRLGSQQAALLPRQALDFTSQQRLALRRAKAILEPRQTALAALAAALQSRAPLADCVAALNPPG